MTEIVYRKLELEQCELIKGMNPSQYIGKAWREIEGKRQLIDINYHDLDWPNGYENHLSNMKKTLINGGIAIGAFDCSNKLIGFVTVNRKLFGERFKYVLLDQLFINLDDRNKGIGKQLFMAITREVKKWGVDRIYICAGSAEETIAFYFSIGCREAEEVNKELYEGDPRDFQLEFVL